MWMAALMALNAASGCKGLDRGAREEFERQFSCPKERVTVTPRPDIDAYVRLFGAPQPTAEVAGDAGRLAVWRAEQQRVHARFRSSSTLFELRGCEHHVLYACAHPSSSDGGAALSVVSCSTVPDSGSPP